MTRRTISPIIHSVYTVTGTDSEMISFLLHIVWSLEHVVGIRRMTPAGYALASTEYVPQSSLTV